LLISYILLNYLFQGAEYSLKSRQLTQVVKEQTSPVYNKPWLHACNFVHIRLTFCILP